jgi:hypothetical protein
MVQAQRFNLLPGAVCPVCYRPGALDTPTPSFEGEVVGCGGCYTSFRFIPGTTTTLPTLERFRAANADARRCACGVFIGSGFETCQLCIAEQAAQARLARAA